MTTIIGIEAKKGEEKKIVLASDITGTRENWHDKGDIAVKIKSQGTVKKLYGNNDIAFGVAGLYDEKTVGIVQKLLSGEINFPERANNGRFDELLEVTLERCGNRELSSQLTTSFLVALSNYKGQGPQLFNCWPLGAIEPREFTLIGSGSDYAQKRISEEVARERRMLDMTQGDSVTLERAVKLAYAGIGAAQTDVYTKGADLVVLGQDGIKQYGDMIRKGMDEAEKRALETIIKDLN